METLTLQRANTATITGATFTIDPTHSTIGFSIRHMVFATVQGRFDGLKGTIRFDVNRPWDTEVEVEIDAASINTGIGKRDEYLCSANFFDVATFPTITFRGTRVQPANPPRDDRWLVIGDLTLRGITREVELAVEQTSGGPELWDVEVASYAATTQISRKDFSIGLNLPLDAGGLVIGDEVRIAIAVQVEEGSVV